MEKLKALLNEKKITRFDYECYLLFAIEDLGKNFLKNVREEIFLEEPPVPTEAIFAWKDGRMSAWRDVAQAVKLVQSLLDGEQFE